MPSYYLIQQGIVVAGQTVLTSYPEASQPDELAQVIRVEGATYVDSRLYCIRSSAYFLGTETGVNDWAILAKSDIKQWQPSLYVPLEQLTAGAKTILYFPKNSSVAGAQWSLYKVTV